MNNSGSLPRRTSSLPQKTPTHIKRSSVGSLLDRTKNATMGIMSKRASQLQDAQSIRGLHSIYDEDDEEVDQPIYKVPRLTSEYFNKYEIMTEFINLRNPNHCPLGVYVMPSSNNLYVWDGVLFIHKGYYKSGAFKFRLTIPDSYPQQPPSVTFLTDMFHPLVNEAGNLSISQQFPIWRPYQDYIFHVLHYVKNIFKKVVLDGLNDKHCPNKESYRLYRTDNNVFGKLAIQCAQLSTSESYLFSHFPESSMIRFSPLSDAKFDELKAQILNSTINLTSSAYNEDTI